MILANDVVAQFPQFQRFVHLYKYARLLKSLDYGEINDTPPWFDELKVNLVCVAEKLRNNFHIKDR